MEEPNEILGIFWDFRFLRSNEQINGEILTNFIDTVRNCTSNYCRNRVLERGFIDFYPFSFPNLVQVQKRLGIDVVVDKNKEGQSTKRLLLDMSMFCFEALRVKKQKVTSVIITTDKFYLDMIQYFVKQGVNVMLFFPVMNKKDRRIVDLEKKDNFTFLDIFQATNLIKSDFTINNSFDRNPKPMQNRRNNNSKLRDRNQNPQQGRRIVTAHRHERKKKSKKNPNTQPSNPKKKPKKKKKKKREVSKKKKKAQKPKDQPKKKAADSVLKKRKRNEVEIGDDDPIVISSDEEGNDKEKVEEEHKNRNEEEEEEVDVIPRPKKKRKIDKVQPFQFVDETVKYGVQKTSKKKVRPCPRKVLTSNKDEPIVISSDEEGSDGDKK